MLKQTLAFATMLGFILALAACNTIEGAGKDVKAAGQGIEKAAEKTKPY
jgi:predicted small secreted protein